MAPKKVSVLGADGWGAKFLLLARSFSGPVFPTLQRVKKKKEKKRRENGVMVGVVGTEVITY